jgi:hypothetical protein
MLMANLDAIVQQLKREREQAAKTVQKLDAALSALSSSSSAVSQKRGSRLSPAARARIAAAQRARWAKVRANKGQKRSPAQKQNVVPISKKRPTLSPAARKKIAAAQRARWAKIKAAQKKSA